MPAPRLQDGLRVTLTGLLVNAFLSAGKIVSGVVGHSQALVADGIESLADLVSSLVVWRGITVAAIPPDREHPYGHGKAEALAAAVVAALLLLAAAFIAYGAVVEILRPHAAPAPFTLAVLVAVVMIKEWLFRWVLRKGDHLESTAIRTDAWHHRSDAITSLLAGVGIAIALVGGPGYEAADDYAALLAAGVIGWNGIRLLRVAMDELMDAAPDPGLVEEITRIGSAVDQVIRVEKCQVRRHGFDLWVDMHIEVPPEMTVTVAHKIAHEVKDRIRGALPRVHDVLVHVEPGDVPKTSFPDR